jgi:3-hydroxymyristoyl/3-hydroxydecanoyl-(acyl carrier protein) dehydratase
VSAQPVPAAALEARTPEILGVNEFDDRVELKLLVPGALIYFRGHFPGFAILPGIVQLDWAIRLGRQHFALGAVATTTIKIKFRKPIRPEHRVTLTLKHSRAHHRLEFSYIDAEGVCSSGQLGFAPP